MFAPRKEYVPYEKDVNVTVHEHRAPTDESVKMLRELEEAALASVLARVPLQNNLFTGEVVLLEDNHSGELKMIGRMMINCQEVRATAKLERAPAKGESVQFMREAFEALVKALQEEVVRIGATDVFAMAINAARRLR